MKKIFFLLAFVVNFALFAQSFVTVDLKDIDGLERPVVGLMDGFVPQSYFTCDLESKNTFDLNYHSSIPLSLDILNEENVYLMLRNKTGAPIVVSFKFDGKWRNFIVKMVDSKEKRVKIDYFLEKLKASISLANDLLPVGSIVLTSGDNFEASIVTTSETKKFKIDSPRKILSSKDISKSTTDTFWAAIVTGHPTVDLDGDGYCYIKVTNTVNGVSNYAWLKISGVFIPNGSCTGYPPHQYIYLSFRVDYPNKGDEWHWQDDEKQSWVLHYCEGDGVNYCYVGNNTARENFNFYTCCLKEKPYETKHEWCNIRNMYWYYEEAWVIRYYPSNDYLKWKVELIHR